MAIKAARGNNKVIIKRKVISNRLADTPQGVYYTLPYYMHARLQYIGADFMGLGHEAFIRNVTSLSLSLFLPDIFHCFMDDKEYSDLKNKIESSLSFIVRGVFPQRYFMIKWAVTLATTL